MGFLIDSLLNTVNLILSKNKLNQDTTNFVPSNLNIVIDKQIRAKYKTGWINKVRPKQPTEIVFHGTGGGNTSEGLLTWMLDGERAASYLKGEALFHYLIDKEGTITEIIDPEYYVYHSLSGSHDKETIGIELINSSKMNRDPYTDKQYVSLFKLCTSHLINIYPTINRITSHRYNIFKYNSPARAQQLAKQCPGTGFNWSKLDEYLFNNKYVFKTEGDLRYEIKKAQG